VIKQEGAKDERNLALPFAPSCFYVFPNFFP
jgi:hypothetical protein